MTKTIPYNTYGTITTRASVTIPASNVPYTYSPLKSDLYIASDLTNVAPKLVVTNMALYAHNNIPNYDTITEIPSGHLPTDINTSLARDWNTAFDTCLSLSKLPNPFYDTNNAIYMSSMFFSCRNLTIVPNFDTSNVTDMSYMFYGCRNLTTVPNFDTSNVTNMAYMFRNCYNLTSVPNFNTSKVTYMNAIFRNCYSLTTVPNFDTSNVNDMCYMFNNCTNLTTVPNFDTSKVTSMNYMFYNCTNLTTVPNFNTSNVTDMSYMFRSCNNLAIVPNFDTGNVTDMGAMFRNCYNIKGNLYIESNNVIDAGYMFYGCPNYTKNIYCHGNTTTYNTIYANMGNSTYNSNWNAYLLTMEDNYAEIPWNENGIYRFPTNKIQIIWYGNSIGNIIEVTPYKDYNLSYPGINPNIIESNNIRWETGSSGIGDPIPDTEPVFKFRFFKDITNMTADVVDTI